MHTRVMHFFWETNIQNFENARTVHEQHDNQTQKSKTIKHARAQLTVNLQKPNVFPRKKRRFRSNVFPRKNKQNI